MFPMDMKKTKKKKKKKKKKKEEEKKKRTENREHTTQTDISIRNNWGSIYLYLYVKPP